MRIYALCLCTGIDDDFYYESFHRTMQSAKFAMNRLINENPSDYDFLPEIREIEVED